MSHPEQSLPDVWIEKIWLAMRATYGAHFDRQWECPEGVDPAQHVGEMRGMWGKQLAVYAQRPEAIKYALENLPPHPPNLVEFRRLCSTCPAPAGHPLGLPAPPRAVPERFRNALAQLAVPLQDQRPERVRVAARYIAMWGVAGVTLNHFKQNELKRARKVLADFEAQSQQDSTREAAHAQAQR